MNKIESLQTGQVYVLPLGKFDFQTFPISHIVEIQGGGTQEVLLDGVIVSTEKDLEDICARIKCFDDERKSVIKYVMTEEEIAQKKAYEAEIALQNLRAKREPLLEALDKYDKNVLRERVLETAQQKEEVDAWYKKILDLNEEAINNPPAYIEIYIVGANNYNR